VAVAVAAVVQIVLRLEIQADQVAELPANQMTDIIMAALEIHPLQSRHKVIAVDIGVITTALMVAHQLVVVAQHR
jgi:hypothetical protein